MSDLQGGTLLLLRLVHRSHLWDDIKSLQSKGLVHSSRSVASLSPFIDQIGVLRVDGRLRNSLLAFNGRHPIILARSHSVTIAIIAHFRSQYWPIWGRKTVMKAVIKFIRCFRMKLRVVDHVMADLPKERLHGSHAFELALTFARHVSASQRCKASLQ